MIFNAEKMNFLTKLDQIYIINLKRRPDRLKLFYEYNSHILEGLNNIKVIEAVDGNEIKDANWEFEIGALGCLKSHYNVIKDAKAKGFKDILILEDDISFTSDALIRLEKGYNELPENWEFLYLYANHLKSPIPHSESLERISCALSTAAYMINHKSYDLLIEIIERESKQIDVIYAHLHFLLPSFSFKVPICNIVDGFSDIINKQTNYLNKKTNLYNRIKNKFKGK
ncbi:MAG: glycosyltransferase family 25 protein [Pedobacter sp.]|nr:MAG: glycosyltransferase family 25 protein [Pedobacter sp.]